MPTKAKNDSAIPQKTVDAVAADMSVIGGRVGGWAKFLTVAPAIAGYVRESAKQAAAAAADQRGRESALSQALVDTGVDLNRVKRGEAIEHYGVSVATPVVDAFASVERGRDVLKRAVRAVEADFTNCLTMPDVRAELGQYAQTIADSELDIEARQLATSDAARALQNLIALNRENAAEVKRQGVGSLFQTKTGDIEVGSVSANRHSAIAVLFAGGDA